MDCLRDSLSKIILFLESPKVEDLCAIVAHIDPVEKHDTSAKSNFHWQLLKCRQLIFTEPNVLSSPVFGNESCIYVIMTHEFFKTGKIQLQLEKLKMNVYSSISLSNDVYESCLRYTILAHIAPQWNKVGEYLVQGRNFLDNESPMNAVKMDIGIKNNEMFLVLWPARVRFNKMDFQDLDISSKTKEQVLSDKSGEKIQMHIGDQMIHVLPSLKKAYVVSISKKLPPSCPFKSYKELKRHWKNMYGYRLPDGDDSLVYYTVAFQPWSTTLYTYPSLCIRPSGLLFLGRVDGKDVLRAFVKDVAIKMPMICGRVFTVGNKLGCAVPRMSQAADVHRIQDVFPTSQKLVPWEGELLTAETLSRLEDPALSAPDAPTPLSGGVSLATPGCLSTPAAGQHFTSRKHRLPSSLADSPPPFVPAALPPRVRDDIPSSQPAERSAGLVRPVFQRRPTLNAPPTAHQCRHHVDGHVDLAETSYRPGGDPCGSKTFHSSGFILPQDQTPVASSPPVSMEAMSRIVKEFQSKRDSDVMIKSDVGNNGKKSRARPQVQPELDVGTLARADDLGRANTATLVKWLRERGITCKVKDKKSDLVAKVRDHLALPTPSSTPCDV